MSADYSTELLSSPESHSLPHFYKKKKKKKKKTKKKKKKKKKNHITQKVHMVMFFLATAHCLIPTFVFFRFTVAMMKHHDQGTL